MFCDGLKLFIFGNYSFLSTGSSTYPWALKIVSETQFLTSAGKICVSDTIFDLASKFN